MMNIFNPSAPPEIHSAERTFTLPLPYSIHSASTVLQLGSFHHLSRVEPWDVFYTFNYKNIKFSESFCSIQ